MGLIRGNMYPIFMEHAVRPLRGDVLFLGFPDTYMSGAVIRAMARALGMQLSGDIRDVGEKPPGGGAGPYTSAKEIFSALGVSSVRSLDVSAFENVDFIHDLNDPALPRGLHGEFDIVIDHGTMEHVFHTPNCLQNIFNLLRVGGRVIHSAPGNNMFDHGFYQYSPTFFADYYATNKWTIERQMVAQFTTAQETEPPFFAFYEPDVFERTSYGGLDAKLYTNIVVATKRADSTAHKIPQQRFYASNPNW